MELRESLQQQIDKRERQIDGHKIAIKELREQLNECE